MFIQGIKRIFDFDSELEYTATNEEARDIIERALLFIDEKSSGDFEAAHVAYGGLVQAFIEAGFIE